MKSLEQVRKMLLDEFGGDESYVGSLSLSLHPHAETSVEAKPETRKESIVRLLKEKGPLTRREIRERTGFPPGTLAYVLNDKETFARMRTGKWRLISKPEE